MYSIRGSRDCLHRKGGDECGVFLFKTNSLADSLVVVSSSYGDLDFKKSFSPSDLATWGQSLVHCGLNHPHELPSSRLPCAACNHWEHIWKSNSEDRKESGMCSHTESLVRDWVRHFAPFEKNINSHIAAQLSLRHYMHNKG